MSWMNKLLNSIDRKRYLAISLSIVLFFSIFCNSNVSVGYALSDSDCEFTRFTFSDGNDQTILDGDINNQNGTIYIYGLHKDTKSGIGYHTVAYHFNLESSNKGEKYYDSSFNSVRIERIEDGDWGRRGNLNKKDPRPGMIWDVYKLKGDDVINAMIKLMRNSGKYADDKAIFKALAKGVPVRISNEFEVTYRETGKKIEEATYKSLSKMRESVKRVCGVDWSDTTYYKVLPFYYDNIITIKLNTYQYKVKYVEQSDFNKHLDDLTKTTALNTMTGGKSYDIEYGGEVSYDLKNKDKVTAGGSKKTYKYVKAAYFYSNGTKNNETKPYLDGNVVKTTHFRHYDGILYIVLKENEGNTEGNTGGEDKPPEESGSSSTTGVNYFDADGTGVINADSKGYERFDVTQGIPTTENLYCIAQGSKYLINVKLNVKTGTKVFPVTATKTYTVVLPPEPSEGGEAGGTPAPTQAPKKVQQVVSQTVQVTREYKYTEIASIDYYKISNANIYNGTLPGGSVTLTPVGYSVPNLTYTHYSESEHVVLPSQANSTITLPSETVEGSVPSVDFSSIVNGKVGQLKVKNDAMSFGGSTVLSSSVTTKSAPSANLSAITKPSNFNI